MPRPFPLFPALALALVASACGASDARPTVVVVLVDQLRQDSAERWLTETRALAEGGVRFEEMRSAAPWTYPSVVSLLSGLYPQQHGADGNQAGGLISVLDERVPLLPRTLRAAGYHAAGFVTNPFLHEWNTVHRAFDHYDASFIGNQGATRGHGEQVWGARMYSDSVNAAVRAYFDGRAPDGPEFVYVHYIDVHGRKNDAERWAQAPFEPSYEGATRYVDGKIAELYRYFLERSRGQLLFLVTSDHGQEAGDDESVGEGKPWRERKASLHDFNLRIPCYVLPSAVVPARVVSEPCSNVDVTPTLLEWVGAPAHEGVPGRSLLAAIRGQAYDGRARTLYARNSAFGRREDCVVHAGEKYVRYQSVRRQDVNVRRRFDLGADPRELLDLGPSSRAEEELLHAAEAGGVAFPTQFVEAGKQTEEDLKSLGYTGDEK